MCIRDRFNGFAALDNKDVTIYRMPGLGHFKRNDVLVFNFPYQMNRWDSIRMNVMQYYVKRCIALPGAVSYTHLRLPCIS